MGTEKEDEEEGSWKKKTVVIVTHNLSTKESLFHNCAPLLLLNGMRVLKNEHCNK